MSNWIRAFKHLCAGAAVAATCGGAYAQNFTFDGATLDISNLATEWSLQTTAFPSSWGSSAFIGAVAVDVSGGASGVTTSNVSGGGVSTVGVSSASGPGGDMDVRFTLGQSASNRLVANETVSWDASGLTGDVTSVALHVQGLDTSVFPEGSLWLTPGTPTTPIPEPGTYALFLLGLLGMGFMLRKKISRFPLPA